MSELFLATTKTSIIHSANHISIIPPAVLHVKQKRPDAGVYKHVLRFIIWIGIMKTLD